MPDKKQAVQEDTDSAYLFGDSVSRFGCGKSSVIKETLEMQSEEISAIRDPLSVCHKISVSILVQN
jgi:hypothetical protein